MLNIRYYLLNNWDQGVHPNYALIASGSIIAIDILS